MEVRKFDPQKDYQDVAGWWTKQGWPALPLGMLSQSGFIAEFEGQKVAATWILPTNTIIYLMEWTVGNPDVSWEQRSEGIKVVTEAGCQWAKQDGATQILTMTKSDRFIEKLEDFGFTKSDSGMTHLIRGL